jgi:ribosomal protein L11 methyltransferase
MSLVTLRFDVDGDSAERWSDALIEAGASAVDLSDPQAGTEQESPLYGEPGEPAGGAWPVARVEALVDESLDPVALLARAAKALGEALPVHETAPLPDDDWVRRTQSQFGPIEIDASLWIVPTWHEPPPGARIAIRLDPGLAFGTGSHPTTRMCLTWLARTIAGGERVLDYGCGSGILAIAASMLGAGEVDGTDIDPQALVASRDNADANRARATFVPPGELPAGTYDVVVANILANPLIALAPLLAARTAPGGRLALAGLLDAQADAIANAYSPWFTLRATDRLDGWVLATGVRR